MDVYARNSNLPISIDLRITKSCNLHCSFCFGTNCSGQTDLDSWFSLLNLLSSYGVKVLVFTGGEPTLFRGLKHLLKYAHDNNFRIVLSTNGTNALDNSILQFIDALSLPIDGEDYETCKLMRSLTIDEYDSIINNIISFKNIYPDRVLKIGTVVTQRNINKLKGIYNIIKDYADVWKLYQVSPHPKNGRYFHELEVSDEEFNRLFEYLNDVCVGKCQLVAYRNSDRSGKYLFCEPNFDALCISDNQEVKIGNFLKNFENVLTVWRSSVEETNLTKNILETYPEILNILE